MVNFLKLRNILLMVQCKSLELAGKAWIENIYIYIYVYISLSHLNLILDWSKLYISYLLRPL